MLRHWHFMHCHYVSICTAIQSKKQRWILHYVLHLLSDSFSSVKAAYSFMHLPTCGSCPIAVFLILSFRHLLYWESFFNVRQSYCARYWYRLVVCPSLCLTVRLSVTRWYCVETAQPIVKLSSLPGSPMILVFWGPNFFPEFQGEHPQRGR